MNYSEENTLNRDFWLDKESKTLYVRFSNESGLVGHLELYKTPKEILDKLSLMEETILFPEYVPKTLEGVELFSTDMIKKAMELFRVKQSIAFLFALVKDQKIKDEIIEKYNSVASQVYSNVDFWASISPLWNTGDYNGMHYSGANLYNYHPSLYERYDINKIDEQISSGQSTINYTDKYGISYSKSATDIIMINAVGRILDGSNEICISELCSYLSYNHGKLYEDDFKDSSKSMVILSVKPTKIQEENKEQKQAKQEITI